MIAPLLAIVAAVTLSPPFSEASATAVDEGAYIGVTVRVRVDPGFGADYVVVHVLNPDGQETFSLGADGSGDYVGTFTILPFNRAIHFEAGRPGEFQVSKTVSLIDLGIPADRLQTTYGTRGTSTSTSKWGWLALGAGALAGAGLLVYWVWPRAKPTRHRLVDTSGTATVVDETEGGS